MATATSTEVAMRDVSTATSIPVKPTARLMYYLDCVCSIIDLDKEGKLLRLRDYDNYRLNDPEFMLLLNLMIHVVPPEALLGKCIFISKELCNGGSNRFLEVSSIRKVLTVVDSFAIAGREQSLSRVMVCTEEWLYINYHLPVMLFVSAIKKMKNQQSSPQMVNVKPQPQSSCCVIL